MSSSALLRSVQAELERSRAGTRAAATPSTVLCPAGTPDGTKPHTSLLTTPVSRHSGGRLAAQPSPSVLGAYERRLEAEAEYSFRSNTMGPPGSRAAAAPLSTQGTATMRFTPRDPSPLRQAPGAAAGSRLLDTAGGNRGLSSTAVGPDISSPVKKPSLVDQYMASAQTRAAAAATAAGSPYYRPSPLAAKLGTAGSGAAVLSAASPKRGTLEEQLRQLRLDCSRTAAQNSSAVASSTAASLLNGFNSRQQQLQDFRIAALPSSRFGPSAAAAQLSATTTAARGSSSDSSASRGGDDQEDCGPMAVNVRLAPMFDAIPDTTAKDREHMAAAVEYPRRDLPSTACLSAAQASAGNLWSLGHTQQHYQSPAAKPGSAAACLSPRKAQPAVQQAATASNSGTAVLLSRIKELEAQLQMERMRCQESSASVGDLRDQRNQLQERVQQQAGALQAAQVHAEQAEARAAEAVQEATALRGEVQRRQSVHSDSIDSISRMQAVSQVQRQENEELRHRVAQLNEAWEQENAHVARLQQQLRDTLAAAGSSESQVAERLRQAEADWEQRLAEEQQGAQEVQRELSSRCQMLAIEKVAHEQAAKQAAAKQQAAEERCVAAEERWRQLAADLDSVTADSEGQGLKLLDARQQAQAASEAVRQLRRQLQEQQQHCEELEAALAGEQERSCSNAARAEAAEVAQQGLGSHVKVAHARLQQLQDQLAEAQQQCQQLQSDNAELQQAKASHQASYERQLSTMEGQLAEAKQERDHLRQRLTKVTADLESQLQAAGQHRQRVAALQQAARDAQAALEHHEAAAAQQAQQALAAEVQREELEQRVVQLECDLQQAREAAAAAEDRLTKASRNGSGASPLRDVVTELRMELQEKDLQLMQLRDDLIRERSKVQEMQRQVLDQAVELDELQRDSSDAFGVRQQLATAQQAEAQLRREVQQLRKQVAAAGPGIAGSNVSCTQEEGDASPRSNSSGSGAGSSAASPARRPGTLQARLDAVTRELLAARQEIERLKAERDRAQEEADGRDTEVMQLQGQLVMLQQQLREEDNWLSPLPDPYG